jgi:hypothetical protein
MMANDQVFYVVMTVVIVMVTIFLTNLYQARSRIIRLKKQGLVSKDCF